MERNRCALDGWREKRVRPKEIQPPPSNNTRARTRDEGKKKKKNDRTRGCSVFFFCNFLIVSSAVRFSFSTGMTDVVDDRERGANGVHAEREPPDELFVEFLLEVLQHQQADGETGQRSGDVRDVADGRSARRRLFERVPTVNGETDVHAGWTRRA